MQDLQMTAAALNGEKSYQLPLQTLQASLRQCMPVVMELGVGKLDDDGICGFGEDLHVQPRSLYRTRYTVAISCGKGNGEAVSLSGGLFCSGACQKIPV